MLHSIKKKVTVYVASDPSFGEENVCTGVRMCVNLTFTYNTITPQHKNYK